MRTNAAHDTLPAVALQQRRLPAWLCTAVSQTYRDELKSGRPVSGMGLHPVGGVLIPTIGEKLSTLPTLWWMIYH